MCGWVNVDVCFFGNVWVGCRRVTRVCVFLCLGNVCVAGVTRVCLGNVYEREGSVGNFLVWVYELKTITLINI